MATVTHNHSHSSSNNNNTSNIHTQHSIQLLHSSAANGHSIGGMPHGLGLLTTVASLPPKYRSRYLNIKIKTEIPLDLSVKPVSPQLASDVPMATQFTEVYTEQPKGEPMQVVCDSDVAKNEVPPSTQPVHTSVVTMVMSGGSSSSASTAKPTTPPQSPLKRPHHELSNDSSDNDAQVAKVAKLAEPADSHPEATPSKPIKLPDTAPCTAKSQPPAHKPSKNKATRKLKFDEETSSPVSGTIIRPLEDITDGTVQYSNGDIDPKYNIVEITEETKAELAAIKNVIGDYICKLCRLKFDDAFGLARHRCACIVLLEYRCPECGKQFNCPANLASHRRWHKPKKESGGAGNNTRGAVSRKENRNTTNTQQQSAVGNSQAGAKKNDDLAYGCDECGKKFKRQAYLRKHQLTHSRKEQSVEKRTTTGEPAQTKAQPQSAIQATSVVQHAYPVYAPSSSASSQHSYSGTHEDEGVYTVTSGYDYDMDSMSDCSNSSGGYGRLQIIESGLTEEENIAAAALTTLRNCASVIQHTTLAH